jgi:hypothetical protein
MTASRPSPMCSTTSTTTATSSMSSTTPDDDDEPLEHDVSDDDDDGVTLDVAVTDALDGVDNDSDELHVIDTHRLL